MDGTEIKPINTIYSTAVEVELTVEQPATPKRKSSRWRSMSSVITHSTAISEDTKRIMDAFHALDDLTVEPEQGHIWKDHGYRLVALVVVLPSVAYAAWTQTIPNQCSALKTRASNGQGPPSAALIFHEIENKERPPIHAAR